GGSCSLRSDCSSQPVIPQSLSRRQRDIAAAINPPDKGISKPFSQPQHRFEPCDSSTRGFEGLALGVHRRRKTSTTSSPAAMAKLAQKVGANHPILQNSSDIGKSAA
ncbi:hypothetical protein, partial [Rhizobium leguminosarum]